MFWPINFKYFYPIAPKLGPVVNSQTQPENSTFAVFCLVQIGSSPLFFEWLKNGKSIKTYRDRQHIENSETLSTLKINKLNREDAGNYSCRVKNAFGSDSLNVLLNVKGKCQNSYLISLDSCNNMWTQ